MRPVLYCSILFLLLLSCGTEAPAEPTRTRADVLLQKSKERLSYQLVSPSTAVYIDSLSRVTRLNDSTGAPGNKYSVNLVVDAQNSFGGTLRKRPMAIFEQTGPDSLNPDHYTVAIDF